MISKIEFHCRLKLYDIPEEIGTIQTLEVLNLGRNPLKSLPKSLISLVSTCKLRVPEKLIPMLREVKEELKKMDLEREKGELQARDPDAPLDLLNLENKDCLNKTAKIP